MKKLLENELLENVNGGITAEDLVDRKSVNRVLRVLPNIVPDTDFANGKDISDTGTARRPKVNPDTLEVRTNGGSPRLVLC